MIKRGQNLWRQSHHIGAHQGGVNMAVYSRREVLEALVVEEEMTLEDAVEHYEYNVSGSLGLGYPVFMLDPDNEY